VPGALRPARVRRANRAVATTVVDVMDEHEPRQPGELQTWKRQKRTFDLAMTASKMGTWRYTLADDGVRCGITATL